MGKKGYESRRYGQFNVAGVTHMNETVKMTRLDWIRKYVQYGARFVLEREPDNEHDPNAIKVLHVLKKSGRKIEVGYVPNNPKNPLADEWAPLMDEFGWNPELYFGRRYLIETDEAAEKFGMEIGDVCGLAVRYAKR